MRRHLWWIVFAALVGGSYLYLQQPEVPGAPVQGTFRWSMLWAPDADVPPSDRLADYVDSIDRIFGPLDPKFDPPVKPLKTLAGNFRSEAAKTRRSRLALYQAAIVVADGLVAGVENRRQVTLALAQARADTLSFRDPITGRMTLNRTFHERQITTAWNADAAVRRERLKQWYAVLKQREQAEGFYGVIGR